MTGERLDELDLPAMVADNTAPHGTAFTVSIEAMASPSLGAPGHADGSSWIGRTSIEPYFAPGQAAPSSSASSRSRASMR